MRRLFLAFLVVCALVAAVAPTYAQQSTPSAGGPALGEPAVIVGANGEPVGQLVVTEMVDPFEGYDPGSAPQRGFHYVMIDVVLAATSNQPIAANNYGFWLIDKDGYIAQTAYVYRAGDTTAQPDFPGGTVEPGQQASGVLFFSVLNGSTPSLITYQPISQQQIVAANLTGATVEPGQPVSVVDNSGQPMVDVTVDGVVDEVIDFEPSSPPQRGFAFTGVIVTIKNTGSGIYQVNPGAFSIVDPDGFIATSSGAYRTAEGTTALPDLQYGEVAPGAEVSGLITFQVLNGTTVESVLFAPSSDRQIRVAEYGGGGPAPVAMTPIPRPTVAPTATPNPECAAAKAWSDGLTTLFLPIESVFTLIQTASEAGTVDATALESAISATEQAVTDAKEYDTPEVAAAARDQIVSVLELVVVDLEAMKEASDNSDTDGIKKAGTDATNHVTSLFVGPLTDLGTTCPEINE